MVNFSGYSTGEMGFMGEIVGQVTYALWAQLWGGPSVNFERGHSRASKMASVWTKMLLQTQ